MIWNLRLQACSMLSEGGETARVAGDVLKFLSHDRVSIIFRESLSADCLEQRWFRVKRLTSSAQPPVSELQRRKAKKHLSSQE